MFVFFEFFAPFRKNLFKKLWINRPNCRLPVPARIPKNADRGASWWCARALKNPP